MLIKIKKEVIKLNIHVHINVCIYVIYSLKLFSSFNLERCF